MTLKDFRDLPAFMTRKKMKEVTGLSNWDIEALVAAGTLTVWKRPARSPQKKAGQRRGPYGRYYTVEVAKLCGFDLSK